MESNPLIAIFLPASQFIVMLWMGINLTVADFTRLRMQPKATLLGLATQLLILPVAGILIALTASLSPELAVGLVLIAACPGGSMSNIITLMARGDIALSVTLTAISSVVTVFTIPLVLNWAMRLFMEQSTALQLDFWTTVLQIALITLLPIAIGMTLKQATPGLVRRIQGFLKWFSLTIVVLVLLGMALREWENFPTYMAQVGGAVIALNLVTMGLGFAIASSAKLEADQTTSITIEAGIQNATLALAVAVAPTMLNSFAIAIPGIVYGTIMILSGSLLGTVLHRRSQQLKRSTAPNGSH